MAKDSVVIWCELTVFVKSAGLCGKRAQTCVCVREFCLCALYHSQGLNYNTKWRKHQWQITAIFMQRQCWNTKTALLTEERRIVVSLCHSSPNWSIVLEFNLSPEYSAPAKHNTAPGSFRCRPGKQLLVKGGVEGRGDCLSISIPSME